METTIEFIFANYVMSSFKLLLLWHRQTNLEQNLFFALYLVFSDNGQRKENKKGGKAVIMKTGGIMF